MSLLFSVLSILLATTQSLVTAQVGFDWIWPPPFGLVESQKSISPCGGFNTSHDLVTHYLNQLRWNQSASQITYMTRVAPIVDVINATNRWTELYPVVQAAMNTESSSGSNQFCIPVSQPAGIDSPTTIFQLIANTPAGIIFACSRVSFQPTAGDAFAQNCNPSIRGNNTVNNITDPTLLSAAALPPGATATAPSSTSSEPPTASSPQETSAAAVSSSRKHISGGAIAGIVIGSIVGACLLLALVFLLFHRRSKKATSGTKVLSESDTSRNESTEHRTSELPAVVPGELSGEGTTRSELPGNEKLLRPELPAYSSVDGAPHARNTPAAGQQRASPETAAVSPVSSTPHGGAESPVSPIVDRKRHPSIG